MPNDINELDVNDIGLKQIMGERFQDIGDAKPTEPEHPKDYCYNHASAVKVAKTSKPMDASWEPAERTRNWMDSLKACAKSTVIFGGLNLLIFYWQVKGLMAYSVALPCMLTCAFLAGFGIGRAWRER